jgi:hypothetical protein
MKSKGPKEDNDEDQEYSDVHQWWHTCDKRSDNDLDAFDLVDTSQGS